MLNLRKILSLTTCKERFSYLKAEIFHNLDKNQKAQQELFNALKDSVIDKSMASSSKPAKMNTRGNITRNKKKGCYMKKNSKNSKSGFAIFAVIVAVLIGGATGVVLQADKEIIKKEHVTD